MTPSEKKAREMEARKLASFLRTVIEDGGLESVGVASACVEKVSSALSEAERRGFERAKKMACKKAEDFREDLENLRYEEEAK